LPDPGLSIAITAEADGRATVLLSAIRFACHIRLGFADLESQPTLSDNYFNLAPGAIKSIQVSGLPASWNAEALRSRLRIRHLQSGTAV
jgi:hypothetical protein